MPKKTVVVLGAGFGGLRAAVDIARGLRHFKLARQYDVILIDRSNCHLFTPLLYKVAASPNPRHENFCLYDTASLIGKLPIRFISADISSLDLKSGDVMLADQQKIHADYLIIALGSETNYFGIPGLKENALQFKDIESAQKIREAIDAAFAKGGNVKIVAGGAGPNGVELASEIRYWANRAQKKNPNLHVSISIVEAMGSILPGFNPKIQAIAAKRLKKLGIDVALNTKITAVSTNEIGVAEAKSIPFDIFVWTGGTKTPDILSQLPIAKDAHGKPFAQSDMACVSAMPDLKLAPMIYGLGDSVCFMNEKTGKPVPAVAHAAILEAQIVARNVLEEIKRAEFSSHKLIPEIYHPQEYPYVIPAGENWAVAKLGPFIFSGWLGWEFSRLVELNYLFMIMPWWRAMKVWQR